jgi:sulfur carrier protein ThiS
MAGVNNVKTYKLADNRKGGYTNRYEFANGEEVTVEALLERAEIMDLSKVMVRVNGEHCELGDVLSEGDLVTVTPAKLEVGA